MVGVGGQPEMGFVYQAVNGFGIYGFQAAYVCLGSLKSV